MISASRFLGYTQAIMQTSLSIFVLALVVSIVTHVYAQDASLAQQYNSAGFAESAIEEDAQSDSDAVGYTQPVIAPSVQPSQRRMVGVYQQPTEHKLTCADYSMHYFKRHPAMAAVCGIDSANAAEETLQSSTQQDVDLPEADESIIHLPEQP
jgi:hypothetical protein